MRGATEQQLAVMMARNALLRAWKAYGLPLRIDHAKGWGTLGTIGQWMRRKLLPDEATRPPPFYLSLVCERCERRARVYSDLDSSGWAEVAEHDGIMQLEGDGCSHLRSISDRPIPEEVRAIAELELLAGGE